MTRKAKTSQVQAVRVAELSADPDQPRRIFRAEDLAQLRESMRESGLIQPITVRTVAGGFRIIAGERRYRAALELGWETIDAIVRDDLAGADVLAVQVLENIGRANMTPIEEGRAYRRLLDLGWDEATVQKRLGLPNWVVGWRLDLLRLVPEIQQLVECQALPPRVARYLTRLSEDGQRRALARLNREQMNDGQVAAMVDALEAEEQGVDMFPELRPVTAETRRTVKAFDQALDAAVAAVRGLAAIEDGDLAPALAANLPGTLTKTRALRSEIDRQHRRLEKLQSALQTQEAS